MKQKTNRARGKSNEKAIAKLLGGERLGVLGSVDVRIESKFYIECKSLSKYPKWFTKFWNQAISHTPEGKVPVLQLHLAGTQHEKTDVIVLPLSTFKDYVEMITSNG